MTTESLSSKGSILKDLQEIYLMALGKGQYTVAFKIKELLGRELGLFTGKCLTNKQPQVSIEDLSEEDIAHLIAELEAKLKLDR